MQDLQGFIPLIIARVVRFSAFLKIYFSFKENHPSIVYKKGMSQ